MLQFSASTMINAPIEKIWAILSDVGNFASWNSGVAKVEGSAALGSKIKLFSEVSPGKAFPLKVTAFEPNSKMVFASSMPFGLFKGERTYTLTNTGADVKFDMTEIYTGPLAAMITKSIPDLNPSFQKFADGLKAEAEK
jgi:hypothetical protein